MGTRLAVSVDRDACIGSGMCVFAAPEIFTQDDAAKAVVLTDAIEDHDAARAAVESCPTRALTIDEGA